MFNPKLKIYFFLIMAHTIATYVNGAELKKTIAVSRFEDGSSAGVLGQGMADQLSDALVQSGKFVVIERKTLYDITSEQDLATGGRAAASQTAQKGKLLPAQILIRGAITEFSADKQTGGTGINVGGVNIGSNKVIAHVGLILMLIDTTSGQITDSFRVNVEAKDKGSKINVKFSIVDFNKEEFKKTPLGQATQSAIDTAVFEVTKRMAKIPFEGRIIKVEGNTVYTNVGSRSGVSQLETFEVYQSGEQLIDPVTGENLGSEKMKVGYLKITAIEEKFSKGSVEIGASFKIGMILKETVLPMAQNVNVAQVAAK